jgi:hypothetical protein
MRPTTSGLAETTSRSPHLPMPVSTFTCSGIPSGSGPSAKASSRRASRAARCWCANAGLSTITRASGKAARRWIPSPTVATHNARAPSSSAVAATVCAP